MQNRDGEMWSLAREISRAQCTTMGRFVREFSLISLLQYVRARDARRPPLVQRLEEKLMFGRCCWGFSGNISPICRSVFLSAAALNAAGLQRELSFFRCLPITTEPRVVHCIKTSLCSLSCLKNFQQLLNLVGFFFSSDL